MRFCPLRSIWLLGLLIACPGAAQVYWKLDFDGPSQFNLINFVVGGNLQTPFPLSSTNIDLGPPHGNVLCLQADSSYQVHNAWTAGCMLSPPPTPTAVYDPAHTFLKFDVLVPRPRPFHARLGFANTNTDDRSLDIDVTPAATNVFETFLLPLSAFTTTTNALRGSPPPNFPGILIFSISGDPANPAATWPSAADDMFMVDNIAYLVSPPLSISSLGETLVVSWPTNTTGFVLQQTVDFKNWSAVTNTPFLGSGMNQVVLSPASAAGAYRLSGP